MLGAVQVYQTRCSLEGRPCLPHFFEALRSGNRKCVISAGSDRALMDVDLRCVAVALCEPHHLRSLVVEDANLSATAVAQLLLAMKVNKGQLRELTLCRCHLNDATVDTLATALAEGGLGFRLLDLSENCISSAGCSKIIKAMLSQHFEVTELSLHHNLLDGEAAIELAHVLRVSSRLRHLHLGFNRVLDRGAIALAHAIPFNTTLTTLDLSGNRLCDESGKLLASLLVASSAGGLQRLSLRRNGFADDTFFGFAVALRQNTSLLYLSLGLMTASPAATSAMLSSLQWNRALCFLDIMGWSVDAGSAGPTLETVLSSNGVICAIANEHVSADVLCHVARCNRERVETHSQHAVYVGGDEQRALDAAAAGRHAQRTSSASSTFSTVSSLARRPSPPRSANGGSAALSDPAAAEGRFEKPPTVDRSLAGNGAASGNGDAVELFSWVPLPNGAPSSTTYRLHPPSKEGGVAAPAPRQNGAAVAERRPGAASPAAIDVETRSLSARMAAIEGKLQAFLEASLMHFSVPPTALSTANPAARPNAATPFSSDVSSAPALASLFCSNRVHPRSVLVPSLPQRLRRSGSLHAERVTQAPPRRAPSLPPRPTNSTA